MTQKSAWNMLIPVISTAHAPSEEAIRQLPALDFTCAAYTDGFFICVGDDGDDNEPAWVTGIRSWLARAYDNANGTPVWVRLDADGDLIDELQKWEW